MYLRLPEIQKAIQRLNAQYSGPIQSPGRLREQMNKIYGDEAVRQRANELWSSRFKNLREARKKQLELDKSNLNIKKGYLNLERKLLNNARKEMGLAALLGVGTMGVNYYLNRQEAKRQAALLKRLKALQDLYKTK